MSSQTQLATKESPSVIQDMADRYGMDKRAFEATIRATCMPSNVNVSNEQFAAFLLVAKQYKLNPITKEIYAFPSKGGIQPIVGIDGWSNIINSNPQFDGIETIDHLTEGKITAITCKIYRKDRGHPTECTEYLSECKRDTQPWNQWPARMLRHKAIIQCARYAFSLSGIVDPDEAERMDMIDVTLADKNAHFMKEVRLAIQDEMNAPMKEVAAEAAAQVASGVSLKKSPFKTHVARENYKKCSMSAFDSAKTPEELEIIHAGLDDLNTLAESENEHDRFAFKDINNHYRLIRNRLLIATRETAESEDSGTFDADEAPPYIRQEMEAEKERQAAVGLNY